MKFIEQQGNVITLHHIQKDGEYLVYCEIKHAAKITPALRKELASQGCPIEETVGADDESSDNDESLKEI